MKKKETLSQNENLPEEELVQCELCNENIEKEEIIEISGEQDSTILCTACAGKFNNLSAFYDE